MCVCLFWFPGGEEREKKKKKEEEEEEEEEKKKEEEKWKERRTFAELKMTQQLHASSEFLSLPMCARIKMPSVASVGLSCASRGQST